MDQLTTNLAHDYADFVKVDMADELTTVGETVEDILTRLEEFESLLEGVHNGGTSSLIHLGPEIKISCQALGELFQRVDKLEKFVQRVKKDVNNIEVRMDAAETSSGLPSSDLRSFFKPLFSKKADPTSFPEVSLPVYEPPEIFKTVDYFPENKVENSPNNEN